MNEYRNIDSSSNAKKTDADKEPIDGEKFKKVLKVDASEETGKREQRNRPQKAEEEEDPDETSASIPVPQGLFKEYMGEKEQKPSALDGGDGSKVNFVLEGDSSSLQDEPTSNVSSDNTTSNITIQSTPQSLTTPQTPEIDDSSDQTPPPEQEDDQLNNISNQTPTLTQNFQPESFVTSPFSSDTEQDNPINSQQNTQSTQNTPAASPKDKSKTSAKEKQPPLKGIEEKEQTAIKNQPLKSEQIKTTLPNIKKEKTIFTPEVKEKDKTESKIVESSSLSDQKQQGDKQKEPSSDEIAAVAPAPLISPTGIAIPPLSPFSNMPNDVFNLFQKMVGLMQITKDSGKSTTSVTLNMPNSIFNKCELVLEHYDTAPHAYNAQLFGNPEAIAKFANNMKNLNNAIHQSKLSFSINLLPPKLSKAYSGRVERKDSDKERDKREE
jgi:hypothetical protein